MSKADNFTKSFFTEQIKCIEKLSKQEKQIKKMFSNLKMFFFLKNLINCFDKAIVKSQI